MKSTLCIGITIQKVNFAAQQKLNKIYNKEISQR